MRPLMLFAAGFGTRMGALTADRPKPLIPVAGRALIDHALDLAVAADADPVVVNLHYRGDQIRQHLAGRSVTYSEEVEILETGGGLLHALEYLGKGPVFTLNSDAVWTGDNPLVQLEAAWDGARMDGLLLVAPSEDARGHGVRADFALGPDGRLTRSATGVVYLGAQILRTEGLAEIGERVFSLNRLWDRMIEAGRLFGVIHAGGWCDVGRPETIAEAEAMLAVAGRV
jgi:MurNAc alpha-1-phosphate uridylyltransferase